MSKKYRFLEYFTVTALMVLLLFILILGISHPANNLLPRQMLPGVLFGTACVLAVGIWWMGGSSPSDRVKESKWIWIAGIAIFGAAVWTGSLMWRNAPYSFVDYGQVYEAAKELAEGKEITNQYYFLTYPNNFKLMLFLSAVFRIAGGDAGGYVLMVSLNVAGLLAAVVSVCYLLGGGRMDKSLRLPALFSFAAMLPVYANTQAFYTDAASLFCAPCVLACLGVSYRSENRIKTVMAAGAAGILMAVGFTFKVTACIPLIAAMLTVLFSGQKADVQKIKLPIILVLFFVSFALCYRAVELWALGYEVYRKSAETGNPIISWIALGMKADGSWGGSSAFGQYINSLTTKAEKQQYSVEYIKENIHYFWDPAHLKAKLICNYANANLGTKDFTYNFYDHPNLLYDMFSPWGRYYWRTSQICFVYVYSIYAVYFAGCVVSLRRLFKKQAVSRILIMADLSFLGYAIFLMIWEANSRQLYNQIPILLLGFILNLKEVTEEIGHVVRRRRKG